MSNGIENTLTTLDNFTKAASSGERFGTGHLSSKERGVLIQNGLVEPDGWGMLRVTDKGYLVLTKLEKIGEAAQSVA